MGLCEGSTPERLFAFSFVSHFRHAVLADCFKKPHFWKIDLWRNIDVRPMLCDYANLSKSATCEPLAQSVEHLPFKQRVVGSSPTRLTFRNTSHALAPKPILFMKKKSRSESENDPRPEYDFNSNAVNCARCMTKGSTGCHSASGTGRGEGFPDSDSVNDALRFLIRVTKGQPVQSRA